MNEVTEKPVSWTAGAIARERLEAYLKAALHNEVDDTVWEFYTYILNQAKKHRPDRAGCCPAQYTYDAREAKERNRVLHPERF
jgi:hypothetical protein